MINNIKKVSTHRKKRLGRGYGSGKGGHTVGKGQKGQKTRKRLSIMFEGMKVKKSLIKRLPFLRGKNKFKSQPKPVIVKLTLLNDVPAGSVVDTDFLVKNNFVKKDDLSGRGVKILGNCDVTKKLIVRVPMSKEAEKKILKAGGETLSESSNK